MDFVTVYIIVADETKPMFERRSFEAVGRVNIKEIRFARKNTYLKFVYNGSEFNEVDLYNSLPYRGPYYIINEDYRKLK